MNEGWRHEWEDIKVGYIEDAKRRCKKCGAEQTITQASPKHHPR